MNGGPTPQSQGPNSQPQERRRPNLHALNAFAAGPEREREPLDLGDDDENGDPVDNLAASVGIISAVVIGLVLWAIILGLFLWLK